MAGSNDNYRVYIINSGIGTQTIAGIQTQGHEYGVYVDNDTVTRNISAGIVTSNSLSTGSISGTSVNCSGITCSGTVSANTFSANNLTITGGLSANVTGNIRITGSAPSSATSSGLPGQIRYDSGYIYVCVASNTWKRAELLTW